MRASAPYCSSYVIFRRKYVATRHTVHLVDSFLSVLEAFFSTYAVVVNVGTTTYHRLFHRRVHKNTKRATGSLAALELHLFVRRDVRNASDFSETVSPGELSYGDFYIASARRALHV